MKGNFVVCNNEIFVEGTSIGHFASMEVNSNRETIASTATIELPLYTIAAYEDGTPPGEYVPLTRKVRVGIEMDKLKVGARIEVYCWYSCPELKVTFERRLCFRGYIRQVVGSFPTIIRCEDMSFPLRFGNVEKVWQKNATLSNVINAVLPISNEAFSEQRKKQGLNDEWTRITAADSEVVSASYYGMEIWKDISPYDALQKLVSMFSIFGQVDENGRLYVGAGQSAPTNKTVELDTRLNVIGCDLTTMDSMFTNFCITIKARTSDGKLIEYKYGDPDGEQIPARMMPVNTQVGIEQLARNIYNRHTGDSNSGTITTLLYPRVDLFDFVTFEHSLFPDLSGDYICIGVDCKYGDTGYRQTIKVTDKKFVV